MRRSRDPRRLLLMEGVDIRHNPSLVTSILMVLHIAAPPCCCADLGAEPCLFRLRHGSCQLRCWPVTLCSPLPPSANMNASLHRSAFFLIVHLLERQRRASRALIRLDSQEDILPRIALVIRIIGDVLDQEHLLDHFQEVHVSPSPPLEAEVADGIGANEVTERLL